MNEDAVAQELSQELSPGERLVWSARPRQGLRFRASDWYLVPFSLLWGGFAIFFLFASVREGAPLFFQLFGVPFALFGLYVIAGRFFTDAYLRANTAYGVTNERILFKRGVVRSHLTSLDVATLSDLSLVAGRDGRGTIWFGPQPPWPMFDPTGNWIAPGLSPARCFEEIDDAKSVYELVRATKREQLRVS